jgi:glutathione S-transferase
MTVRKVTLFLHPGASSLFPHILLNEVGIPFTPKVIGGNTPALLNELAAINPKQQVPTLVIDGDVITENPAIAQAINQLAPERQLMGRDPKQFIRACEWLNWISGPLHAQAWGPYIRPHRFTTDPAAEEGIREKCKDIVLERFDTIESALSDEGWALGDDFTAVDAYLLPFFFLCKVRVRGDTEVAYPKWSNLMKRVQELDSVKTALATEARMREELGPEGRLG